MMDRKPLCMFRLGIICVYLFLTAISSGCRFDPWSEYHYQYRAAALVDGVARSPSFDLACTLVLQTSDTGCDAMFQVSACSLTESDGAGKTDESRSSYLSADLGGRPFAVKYTSTTEAESSETSGPPAAEFYASPSESVNVLNLKRGIASFFQLPRLPQLRSATNTTSSTVLEAIQDDIFGACPTKVKLSQHDENLADWTVETSRDLVVCNLSYVSNSQQSPLSFFKVLTGGVRRGPIAELTYPHDSKITCKYSTSTTEEIKGAACEQTQVLNVDAGSGNRRLALVTTDMVLLSKQDIVPGTGIDYGDAVKMDWAMDFKDEADLSDTTDDEKDNILGQTKSDAYNVEAVLQRAIGDVLSQGKSRESTHSDRTLASVSFRRLAVLMRRMDQPELTLLGDAALSCRETPRCNTQFKRSASNRVIQSVRERLFTSALMTCGSDPCVQVFTTQWLVPGQLAADTEEMLVTSNMGLFYTPSPLVAETLLVYCKEKKTSWCWLSLTAMLHRLYEKDSASAETKTIIFGTVTSLLEMVEGNCESDNLQTLSGPARDAAEDALATAIKAIINLRSAAHDLHDVQFETNGEGTVLRALLHCVRNSHIRLATAKDSVKALRRVGARQLVMSELLDLIRDESRPVVLRAAMFDVLITHDDIQTLGSAVAVLQETQMENIRTYILSKIFAVLECQDPDGQSLRSSLREVMQEHRFSELDDSILSKSHVTHISRYFDIPFTELHLGGWLTLTLVYTPESTMLHSTSVSCGLMVDKSKVKLLDLDLDFEGMDTLKEALEKQGKKHSKRPKSAMDVSALLEMLQQYIETMTHQKPATFAHLHKRIRSALEKLMAAANLKKATFPRASMSFGTQGYEFGSLSSDDVLKHLRNVKKQSSVLMKKLETFATNGLDTIFFNTIKVLEDQKVLPTAAGFVLKKITDVTAVTQTSVDASSNVLEFLSKKRHDVEGSLTVNPSLSFAVFTDLKVKLAGYTSIGIYASVRGVLKGDLSTDLRLEPGSAASQGSHSLQLTKSVPRTPFTFVHIDAESYTLQNGVRLQTDSTEQLRKREFCLPEVYSVLTGRRACLSMLQSPPSGLHAWSDNDPLQSFTLDGVLTTEDEYLEHYKVIVLLNQRGLKGFNYEIQFQAPGSRISREVKVSVEKENSKGSLQLECRVPDADLTYSLAMTAFANKQSSRQRFASVLTRAGKCWNSFIYEKSSGEIQDYLLPPALSGTGPPDRWASTHINITVSGLLSVDLETQRRMSDRRASTVDVFLNYYCDPRLRLLYALHPDASMAAAGGHTSEFSFHQEFDTLNSFAQSRRGFHSITLLIPGRNLTAVTTIKKNLKGAERNSDLYWTTPDGMDFLHTVSQVSNLSTADQFHFDYNLTATKNNVFDVTLKGHAIGPWKNPIVDLHVLADIEYAVRGHEGPAKVKRSKRSLSSMMESLEHMESAVEEEAVSLFHTVKSSLSNMFRSSENKTQNSPSQTAVKETTQKQLKPVKKDLPPRKPSLWEIPRWKVGVSARCRLQPRTEPTIADMDVSGPEINWDVKATMPERDLTLFHINGTAYHGAHPVPASDTYRKWLRIHLWDQIHHLSLRAWADHRNNPREFLHQHNWTLVETDQHTQDRSFLVKVHLQSKDAVHYDRFTYHVDLTAPRTNLSHHIDYQHISPTEHKIRAYALLHNSRPPFDLAYVEKTDVTGQTLDTHINLTSSVLDYQLTLCGRSVAGKSTSLDSELRVDSRLPSFPGEQTLSTSLVVSRKDSSAFSWVYMDPLGAERSGRVSLLGPKLISLNAELDKQQHLWWTIELVEPTRVKHTVTLSPALLAYLAAFRGQAKPTGSQISGQMELETPGDTDIAQISLGPSDSVEKYLLQSIRHAQVLNNTAKVKFYKLCLGMVHVINELVQASPPAHAIQALHLDKAFSALQPAPGASSVSQSRAEERKISSPSIVRRFFKLYGKRSSAAPTVSAHEAAQLNGSSMEVAEGSRTFVLSAPLPVVMTSFDKLPHMTMVERQVWASIKRLSTGARQRSRDIAVIMHGWNFKTFDGRNLHFADPERGSCTYLLGGDLRHGQFVLTYTREGLTVSTRDAALTLHRDGSVSAKGDETIGHLPYTSADGLLTLDSHKGHLHVSVVKGQADISFSPNDDAFLVEMDTRLNNASLGLLGTNNNEKGEDLRLPHGSLAQDSGEFQNSYELTGRGHCKVATRSRPDLCQGFDVSRKSPCMSLSDQWPEVVPCLLSLDPRPFLWQCQVFECEGKSGCPAIAAYLDTCRHHGITVGHPPVCEACRVSNGEEATFDLVIAHSLHHSLQSHHSLAWVDQLIKHLAHVQNSKTGLDARVGLVTFGGLREWDGTHAMLLNGKLLQTPSRAHHALKTSVHPGKKQSDAVPAVLMASDFPFRKNAVRIILLVHDGLSTDGPSPSVLKQLQSRGIVLVASAPYDQFSDSGVLGQWASGELVVTGHPSRPPQDPYSKMVKATGGIWLDWNSLKSSHHSRHSNTRVLDEVVSILRRLSIKAQTQRHRCSG